MIRQFIASVSVLTVVAASVSAFSAPAKAHATYQQCIDAASKLHRQNIAAGMSRTVADQIWLSMVNKCKRDFGRK